MRENPIPHRHRRHSPPPTSLAPGASDSGHSPPVSSSAKFSPETPIKFLVPRLNYFTFSILNSFCAINALLVSEFPLFLNIIWWHRRIIIDHVRYNFLFVFFFSWLLHWERLKIELATEVFFFSTINSCVCDGILWWTLYGFEKGINYNISWLKWSLFSDLLVTNDT